MEKGITHIAIDPSKEKIQVSVRFPGETDPVDMCLANRAADVRRMVRKVQRKAPGEVAFCYEAGPCGYALQRQIEGLGSRCPVMAPSLIPVKPGERIKTDRRDARKLRELLEAGLLTEVRPPMSEEEAARDLCRAREDASGTVSGAGIVWASWCCGGDLSMAGEGPGLRDTSRG